MAMQYRVHFGDEFKRAIIALGVIDKQIPRDNDRATKAATQRGVVRAKANALRLPARGVKHRGTRARMSRGVGYHKTPLGYRATTSMPPGEEALPRGFESQWRHPVYGGPVSVVQHSHIQWFTDAFEDQHSFLMVALIGNLVRAAKTVDDMV